MLLSQDISWLRLKGFYKSLRHVAHDLIIDDLYGFFSSESRIPCWRSGYPPKWIAAKTAY